jgi:hypothetical protein
MKQMAKNPAEVEQTITNITNAWTALAPTATFAGMTLKQYINAVQPSLDAREAIIELEEQMTGVLTNRDKVDLVTEPINQQIIKGVVGDPNYGDDSALYEGFGYVRKSQRKTGLSRKTKNVAPKTSAK